MMQLLFAAMVVFVAGLGWAYFRRTRINAAPSTALEPVQRQGGNEPTLFDIYEMRKRDITLLAICRSMSKQPRHCKYSAMSALWRHGNRGLPNGFA